MNNLIKYLLYLLVLLLLVSWLITVGKSCGKTKPHEDTTTMETTTYEISEGESSESDTAESVDFKEELESILEEEGDLSSITEEEDIDYSSYDPKKDVAPAAPVSPLSKTTTESKPTSSSSRPSTTSQGGQYLVIAGSYIHPDNADRMKKKIKNMGFDAEVVVFDLSEYHTVLSGRFGDYNVAQNRVQTLQQKGIDAYVKKQTF